MTIRSLTAADVVFSLECQPEDILIEGNAMASGDDEVDRQAEQWVKDQLNRGNEWAWCYVRVVATWAAPNGETFTGAAGLGACSYESEKDFREGGYYPDLCDEALADLNACVATCHEALGGLVDG
jgi:hypothetical protein